MCYMCTNGSNGVFHLWETSKWTSVPWTSVGGSVVVRHQGAINDVSTSHLMLV